MEDMPRMRVRRRNGRRQDSGYMLLVLMLAVAVLTITMLGLAVNYRRSIVRDREVEMIHRGVQYERAVQLYYRKMGSYPPSMEALENTNKIRFLRKRYKDPMSPDGQWQIAHITDIKLTGASGLTAAAGGPAAAPGGASVVQTNQLQAAAGALSSTTSAASQSTDGTSAGASTSSTAVQTTGTNAGTGPADTSGPAGTGTVLGGGPMLGVISKSKAEGIHSFNDKSHYNEWYFIYDPSQDRTTADGSTLQLKGPYNPNLALGATSTSNGSPGGQTGTTTAPNSPASTGTAPTTLTPPPTTP
jgi:type II secretory pathway pseudopilin PulG